MFLGAASAVEPESAVHTTCDVLVMLISKSYMIRASDCAQNNFQRIYTKSNNFQRMYSSNVKKHQTASPVAEETTDDKKHRATFKKRQRAVQVGRDPEPFSAQKYAYPCSGSVFGRRF